MCSVIDIFQPIFKGMVSGIREINFTKAGNAPHILTIPYLFQLILRIINYNAKMTIMYEGIMYLIFISFILYKQNY